MNVLSLFDGCSGARLALTRANKKIDKYYTCEIDKYSSMVTKLNFPDTIALGDVTKVNFEMLPKIDFLIGGSPCQDLSFAKGNGKGLEGERSGLFYKYFEALEVLRKKNPEIKFLLENVKMKKEWKDIISDLLGVQPIFINSADFSAQNRQRLYWTNIPVDEWIPCEDKLQDIKETDAEDRYYYSPKMLAWIDRHGKRKNKKLRIQSDDDKVQMIEASHFKGCSSQRFFAIEDKKGLRYITITETERAQTVPDRYTKCGQKETGEIVEISNTQRYKMLGNGFNIATVTHIIKNL
tara:strand:- start:58 stop:939 length:882 start_codon:yes stop_codon:yes gene_type:complete